MNVVVTGAAGFLGNRVANILLQENSPLPVSRLLLVDVQQPPPRSDPRVSTLAVDLGQPSAAELVIQPDCDVFFHLAAIVSGQAESDFELGLKINFDATRKLIETARRRAPTLRFVFTSTVGVYGGELPPFIDDLTAVTPQTSYGTAKVMCEMLLNDYGRRGYLDTRIVRLPTVSVRAGAANQAVTSFASGIIREPLNKEPGICPVDADQELWLTSPSTVTSNIVYAATLQSKDFGSWRVVNLPGLCVSVKEMIDALREISGERVASLVKFERNEMIAKMVGTLPSKLDNTKALRLGFTVDKNFADIIRLYIRDDLKR